MAAVSSLTAPPNLAHHHISTAAKPLAIPLNLSFQILTPAHTFASAPLFLTSNPKHSRTRLFVVAERAVVSDHIRTEEEERTLYVGNLRYSIDSDELRKIFEEHGAVDKAEVMYKKQYKKSRGFGFVIMKTVEDANKAIEKLNGAEVRGFKLQVNITEIPLTSDEARGIPLEFINSPHKVVVKNLDKRVNSRSLKKHFAERGNVLSAVVNVDPKTSKNFGYGYVTFSSEEDRDAAIKACKNSMLLGAKMRVTKV